MPSIGIDTPHFAVPFNITAEGAAEVEQDSVDDIFQCVQAICRTPKGTRLDAPEFGIDEVVLREPGPDRVRLERTISYWEPRSRIAIDISSPDIRDVLYQLVQINVGGAF